MCAVSLLCGVYLLGAAYVPLPAQSALPVLPRLERSSTRSKARLATATTPAADAEPISPVINEEADGEATLVGTVAAVAEEDEATLASELVGTIAAVVDVAAPLPQSALMPDDEPAPRRFLDEEAAKAYDRAAIIAGYPKSKLNFPKDAPPNYRPKKRTKVRAKNKSRVKTGQMRKTVNKFQLEMEIDGKKETLGFTNEEASVAYDLASIL